MLRVQDEGACVRRNDVKISLYARAGGYVPDNEDIFYLLCTRCNCLSLVTEQLRSVFRLRDD